MERDVRDLRSAALDHLIKMIWMMSVAAGTGMA